jgi:hypothetical protein
MQIRDTTVQWGGRATYDGACTGDRQRQQQQRNKGCSDKIHTTMMMEGLTLVVWCIVRHQTDIYSLLLLFSNMCE